MSTTSFPYFVLYWASPKIWQVDCQACASSYETNATFWGTVPADAIYSRLGNVLLSIADLRADFYDRRYIAERGFLLSSAKSVVAEPHRGICMGLNSRCPLCGAARTRKQSAMVKAGDVPCLTIVQPRERTASDGFGRFRLKPFGNVLFLEEDLERLGEKELFDQPRAFCEQNLKKKSRDPFPYDLRFAYLKDSLKTHCSNCRSDYFTLRPFPRRPLRYLYSRLGNLICSVPEGLLSDPDIREELMFVLQNGPSLFRFCEPPESSAFSCPYCGKSVPEKNKIVHAEKAVVPCIAKSLVDNIRPPRTPLRW